MSTSSAPPGSRSRATKPSSIACEKADVNRETIRRCDANSALERRRSRNRCTSAGLPRASQTCPRARAHTRTRAAIAWRRRTTTTTRGVCKIFGKVTSRRPGDAPPRSWTTCLSRWWRAHPPPRLPHPPPPATLPRCRVPWSGRVRACPARCAGAGPAVPPPRRRLQPRRAPGRIPPPRQRAALPTCAATLRVVRPPLRRGPRGATRALQLPPQPLRRAQSCPARAARGTRARRAPPPHEAPSRTASQQENPTKPRSGGGTAAGGCAPDVCLYLLVSAASLAALIPMNASRSRLLSGQPTLLAWCTVCCAALSRRWTCRAGRCAATLTSVGVRSQLASLALPLIASRPPAPVFRGRSRALLAVLLCRGGGRGRAWPAGVQRRARRRLCPHFLVQLLTQQRSVRARERPTPRAVTGPAGGQAGRQAGRRPAAEGVHPR